MKGVDQAGRSRSGMHVNEMRIGALARAPYMPPKYTVWGPCFEFKRSMALARRRRFCSPENSGSVFESGADYVAVISALITRQPEKILKSLVKTKG